MLLCPCWLVLRSPSLPHFILYVSLLCLINCSIPALFNGRGRATGGHSRPEVTSSHTFVGSVIISRPTAWRLHKNEIGRLNLRLSWPSFLFAQALNVLDDPQPNASIKRHAVSLGCCVVSSMNMSKTSEAWSFVKALMWRCVYPVLY